MFCDVLDIHDLDFILGGSPPPPAYLFLACVLDEIKMAMDPVTHSRVMPYELCRSRLAHR